jgi:hypothetical protein
VQSSCVTDPRAAAARVQAASGQISLYLLLYSPLLQPRATRPTPHQSRVGGATRACSQLRTVAASPSPVQVTCSRPSPHPAKYRQTRLALPLLRRRNRSLPSLVLPLILLPLFPSPGTGPDLTSPRLTLRHPHPLVEKILLLFCSRLPPPAKRDPRRLTPGASLHPPPTLPSSSPFFLSSASLPPLALKLEKDPPAANGDKPTLITSALSYPLIYPQTPKRSPRPHPLSSSFHLEQTTGSFL